ncbi:hypothetical protein [Streptomyces soliscabiei]|uniref:hypothetical protein n=1 Tax=Streptomyces soliscabiei TaxID=588897 RepID=UPI0029B46560|nr:hypothetical protein [Streptomyces sp. NY05-11A]MDX2676429.1 hypothetical protein [Streptomyces sp. NY05-11A]
MALLETVNAARDRLVVTWLADGGLRIGELCGLHLVWSPVQMSQSTPGQKALTHFKINLP